MLTAPWEKLHVPKELASDFLGVFSRFEYALKAAGYAQSQGKYAAPSWRRFGQAIASHFESAASPELDASVAYLLANPPLRQIYDQTTGLVWGVVLPSVGSSQIESLITYVRCVRNNLFHGGKFLAPPPGAPDRDYQLVSCSLIVLSAIITLDSKVHDAFVE